MIRDDPGMVTLQAVLALLAAYHLVVGATALVAPRTAGVIARSLYGTTVGDAPQLRYAIRMLGLYALALGLLLGLAASKPADHREIIVVSAALLAARAACRVAWRHELHAAFGVPTRRNAVAVVMLVLECLVLAAGAAAA